MELKSRWTVPLKVGYGNKFGNIEKRHYISSPLHIGTVMALQI
jgi:hypothetical protein